MVRSVLSPLNAHPCGVVILAEYPDRKFLDHGKSIRDLYEAMLNEQDYTNSYGAPGSLRDYWKDQSAGNFIPDFYVSDIIELDSAYSFYGANIKGSDSHAKDMIVEACQKLDGRIDLTEYDSNNDGFIDFLIVIFAGHGENDSDFDDADAIWPHQNYFDKTLLLPHSGLKVSGYLCSPEIMRGQDTTLAGIGIIAHEMGHMLGLPDTYYKGTGSTSDKYAMGNWDLMDNGNYNNCEWTPVGLTALERYSLGWIDLPYLEESGDYSLTDIAQSGFAYRISSGNPEKFIVLEARMKTKWYSCDKSKGLLVTAVDYNKNSWNSNNLFISAGAPRVSIIPADAWGSFSSENNDCFPFKNRDSLTINGNGPIMKAGNTLIDKPVTNIRIVDNSVCFHFENTQTGISSAICSFEVFPMNGAIVVKSDSYFPRPIRFYSSNGVLMHEAVICGTEYIFQPVCSGIYFVEYCGKTLKISM